MVPKNYGGGPTALRSEDYSLNSQMIAAADVSAVRQVALTDYGN